MIRIIITAAILQLFSLPFLQAQNLTLSPYSRYGVGNLLNTGSTRNAAMGGIGYGSSNYLSINRLNPASYVDAYRTTLDFAGFFQYSNFTTKDSREGQHTEGFQNVAFVFPNSKQNLALALGFAPYSSVGYNINDFGEVYIEDSLFTTVTNYNAEGGQYQAFVGLGFRISKRVRMGANFAYNFGNTRYNWRSYIQNSSSTDPLQANPNFRPVTISERVFLSGLGGQVGVQYADTIKVRRKKDNSVSNIMFRIGAATDYRLRMNGFRLTEYNNSTVFDSVGVEEEGKVLVPPAVGVGIELSKPFRWSLAADFAYQGWDNFDYFDDTTLLGRSFRFAVGGEWIPNNRSLKYFDRMAYRAGAYRINSYIEYEGKSVVDKGVSLGFGLPTSRKRSSAFSSATINLSFQGGKRGNHEALPLAEWYGRVQLGITVNELWFIKRQVD